jgi:hypothetical protein
MKLAVVLCTIMLSVLGASAAADPGAAPGAESGAESAARAWLALVDAGKYADSWSSAAAAFRQKITAAQWQAAASAARAPLGALKSRTLRSATHTSTLPGAPDGDYVVLQFSSSFEHKESAVETVTPMKDADGQWHVSGYYIR